MILLTLTLSTADIARLAMSGKEDSLLLVLENSVSPGDFILAFDILTERGYRGDLPDRILKMGREKFGRRFMVKRALDYYMSTGRVGKALQEMNFLYSPISISRKLKELEERYGNRVWEEISRMDSLRPAMRRGIIRRLIEDGRYAKAMEMAENADDSVFTARLLFHRKKYDYVVKLLSPLYQRSREATRMYGRALFYTQRYGEAAPILENVDPVLSSRAYMMAGKAEKAIRVMPDTALLIKYHFKKGNLKKVLELCRSILTGECIAALVISGPDSLNRALMDMGIRAKKVEPITGILVEVTQKHSADTVVMFMENVFLDKQHPLSENLLHLSLALNGEIRGKKGRAIEHYSKTGGWLEPFALYRLFILTGDEKYRKVLLNKYPQSAYSAMVAP